MQKWAKQFVKKSTHPLQFFFFKWMVILKAFMALINALMNNSKFNNRLL